VPAEKPVLVVDEACDILLRQAVGRRESPLAAARREPSAASTTVDRGVSNDGIGADRMQMMKKAVMPRDIFRDSLTIQYLMVYDQNIF